VLADENVILNKRSLRVKDLSVSLDRFFVAGKITAAPEERWRLRMTFSEQYAVLMEFFCISPRSLRSPR
jgi:hypothetical protein